MSVVAGGDPNGALKANETPVDQLKPITVKQLEPFLGRPAKGVCVDGGWGLGSIGCGLGLPSVCERLGRKCIPIFIRLRKNPLPPNTTYIQGGSSGSRPSRRPSSRAPCRWWWRTRRARSSSSACTTSPPAAAG